MHGRMDFRDLDPETAQQELQANPELRVLDVRTPEEYASHRLPDATLVPIQELEDEVLECFHAVRSAGGAALLTGPRRRENAQRIGHSGSRSRRGPSR